MKGLLKPGLCGAIAATGLDAWLGRVTGVLHRPWVVGYHTVVADADGMAELMPGLAITTHTLEQHLDWIGQHFEIASLADLPALERDRAPGQKPLAAITFDDGYRGVFDHAWPMLQRKGIPAALFVVTDRIGAAELLAHDQLYRLLRKRIGEQEAYRLTRELLHALAPMELARVAKRLGDPVPLSSPELPASWEMLRKLHASGWAIGSHTRSHALLIAASPAELEEETEGSRLDLEQGLGASVRQFAYPDGAFNPTVIAAVAKAGYDAAYTACAHGDPAHRALTLPRTMLWEHSSIDAAGRFSPSILACQSSGLLELVAGCRKDHGTLVSQP